MSNTPTPDSLATATLRGSDNHPNLSVGDVADYLGVARELVRVWARDKKLRAQKVGGQWRFTQIAVTDFIERRLLADRDGKT